MMLIQKIILKIINNNELGLKELSMGMSSDYDRSCKI